MVGVREDFAGGGEDDDADVGSEEGEELVGLAEKTLAAHGEGDLKAALRLNLCNLHSSLLFGHHALPCSSSRSPPTMFSLISMYAGIIYQRTKFGWDEINV